MKKKVDFQVKAVIEIELPYIRDLENLIIDIKEQLKRYGLEIEK